jgi:hypothetical protein
METIVLEDMEAWDTFTSSNADYLTNEYGSISNAYQHAVQGGLIIGDGAAPLFIVVFAD